MALNAKPLRVQHAYEQVSREIEFQILFGSLKPGNPLPGEVEMVPIFAVNRLTVREGIKRLECEADELASFPLDAMIAGGAGKLAGMGRIP